jgi:hypothetical protein
MDITYRLNTNELNSGFVTALRDAYPDRDIEITVRERFDQAGTGDGCGPASFDTLEEAIRRAGERSPADPLI